MIFRHLQTLLLLILLQASLTIAAQTTLVLQPGPEGKDAVISYISPENNYGNYEFYFAMAWTHSGEPGINRSLISFDLSAIPSNAVVLDAKLNLYFNYYGSDHLSHSGENLSYLQRITSPWEEDLVKWINQPSVTAEGQAILPQSKYTQQDYRIDVTGMVQLMVSDPQSNYGWMLRLQNENPYNGLFFSSGDGPDSFKWPRLEITYITCDPLVADFSYSIDDQTVSFFNHSTPAMSYWWDFGDGNFSLLQDPVHAYHQKGIYRVCITVEDTCGTAEFCDTIYVCDVPLAGFTFSSEGLTVTFQDTSHFPAGYKWDFGDLYFSAAASPWHTYDSSGTYTVCQMIWNECGADSVCQEVFVDYFSVDGLGIPLFKAYPNPFRDLLDIYFDYNGMASVILTDLNGRNMKTLSWDSRQSKKMIIDTRNLPPGVYVLRILLDDKIYCKKAIKID